MMSNKTFLIIPPILLSFACEGPNSPARISSDTSQGITTSTISAQTILNSSSKENPSKNEQDVDFRSDFWSSSTAISTNPLQSSNLENKIPPPSPSPSSVLAGCVGNSSETSEDLVLYNSEALTNSMEKSFALSSGWRIDDIWGNGKIQNESIQGQNAFSFSNENVYHGFKFTPFPRREFYIKGAEVFIQLKQNNTNSPLPTFGLRIIKPNEFEGNGGAPTTSWMVDKPNSNNRFLTAQSQCTLIKMFTPPNWQEQSIGNRLIWEMQSNWGTQDKIIIRKVILKGFKFKN